MLITRTSLPRSTVLAIITVFSALIVAAGLIPANEALAATINVDETTDEYDDATTGAGECSLREAVIAANRNEEVGGCESGSAIGTDVISLPAGTYNLTLPVTGEDGAESGDLDITESVSIVGAPGNSVNPTVDAGGHIDTSDGCFTKPTFTEGTDRVFHVLPQQQQTNTVTTQGINPVSVSFSHMNITGGTAADENAALGGGGILAEGAALDVDDVRVADNFAFDEGEFSFPQGGGIALANESRLEMTDSAVDENEVLGYGAVGGGIGREIPLAREPGSAQEFKSAMADAAETNSLGLIPDVTISNSSFNGNVSCGFALSGGGGIGVAGVSELTNVDFSGNRAESAQFAAGGGANFGSLFGQVFGFPDGSETDYSGGELTTNEAISHGLSLQSKGSFPAAAVGGGMASQGDALLQRLSVTDNVAFSEENQQDVDSAGGGVAHSGGNVSLLRSTVNGNLASAVAEPPSARLGEPPENGEANGGGVYLIQTTGLILNSTVSENTAFNGGGIDVFAADQQNQQQAQGGDGNEFETDIEFTTITKNSSDAEQGAGLRTSGDWNEPGGAVHVYASIIGNQDSGEDCDDSSDGSEEMIQDRGSNIDSDESCDWTKNDSFTANPRLEDLDDNGGPTLTHALKPNSPAVDAAKSNAQGENCPGIDQRGENRPKNGDGVGGAQCDIGSFELEKQGPNEPPFCPGFKNDPRPQIIGTGAADVLNGTNKNEILCGQGGQDTINGGGGDDLVLGGPGDDKLRGQVGDDRVIAAGGEDEVEGGLGDDRLRGFSGNDKINGNEGLDYITGGADDDVVEGDAGNDRVFGWDDDDKVFGNQGDDHTFGSLGDDMVDGGIGGDRVRGYRGDDTLFGRAGGDKLVGNNGDDNLDGGPDTDTCFGGNGTNTLVNCP